MMQDEEEQTWQDVRDESYAEVKIMNDDHKCVVCDVLYPCERPTWDDCDCKIYCGACEEARQETPGP